jgi:hypothetical protein
MDFSAKIKDDNGEEHLHRVAKDMVANGDAAFPSVLRDSLFE